MIDAAVSMPVPDLPGEYTIGEPVKAGRRTVLYQAAYGAQARPVAVRLVKAGDTGHEPAILRSLAALPAHPHLLAVRDTGMTKSGRLYAATDFCPNGSLGDAVRRHGRISPRGAAAVCAMAADALQAAHQNDVRHGDIRPAALLGDGDKGPLLSGFGFGILYRDDRREAVRLAHWSPALLEGGTPTAADDVYGLAATLVTLVSGTPHLAGAAENGLAALIAAALASPVPDLPDEFPGGLRALLAAALSPDPGMRPGSAGELADALRGLDRPAGRRAPAEPGTRAGQPAPSAAAASDPPRAGQAGSAPALLPAESAAPSAEPASGRRGTGGGAYWYGLVTAGAVIAVITAVTLTRADPRPAGKPPSLPVAVPTRAVTSEATPVTRLDQAQYQPQHLTATSGPGEILLTWRLPAGAAADGAGVVIKESPALSPNGIVALSRQGGSLPVSYIAASAHAGQQVCFTVGVLVELTSGSLRLIPAGPVCAILR